MKIAERFNNFPPYQPIEPFEILSKRIGIPVEKIIKLDANENPYGPSSAARQALSELRFPHIYPDPESRELRAALATFTGLTSENIMVGAGADELIDLLLRVVLESGDAVINCPPTFGMYSFDTNLNAGTCINVQRRDDFALDLPAIKKQVKNTAAKILFITSPNNPDGSRINLDDLLALLELPLLVVLDEAYIEFTGDTAEEWKQNSMFSAVHQYENLVVLRTFSKWAGLAGLRVGYGAFPSWIMPTLWAAKQPYNVNIAANAAALASLQSLPELESNVQKIRYERSRLFNKLKRLPYLEPVTSNANYILCKCKNRDAFKLKNKLMEKGIFVRYYQTNRLTDYIRISVGKPDQTNQLIQTLEELQ